MKRKIVYIDEQKCNGCGLCVPACHEGAIRIVDGKARLVADKLCDGLGDCLGECPEGAITIVERDADAYDEVSVQEHLFARRQQDMTTAAAALEASLPCGCPSSQARTIERKEMAEPAGGAGAAPTCLGQWPVQLALVPPQAPYLQDADLLVAADCVPFAYGDFHRRFLKDKALVVACPKLDDPKAHLEKLSQICKSSNIRSINVLRMEVPCCAGLKRIAELAVADSGKNIPLQETVISIAGEVKAGA